MPLLRRSFAFLIRRHVQNARPTDDLVSDRRLGGSRFGQADHQHGGECCPVSGSL